MTSVDMSGRVALVTGGARGIGRAIVEELHARGASVVVADAGVGIAGADADPTPATQFARELGDKAVAFTDDLANDGAVEALVALNMARFGAIDVVVNNAAILRDAFIFKANVQTFQHVLSVNLLLPMALLAATTPRMREQVKSGRAPGRIVNIVSSAGLFGNFGQSAYAASKAGLVGLTRVVAMDLARSGITCNAVAPFAATRVTESIQAANEAQAQYKQRALSLSPKHVALLVAALCEDGNRASGQLFGVRGREVFMFSQPRPVMREVLPAIEAERPQRIHKLLNDEWRSAFVDLSTDLEYFNTEPIV